MLIECLLNTSIRQAVWLTGKSKNSIILTLGDSHAVECIALVGNYTAPLLTEDFLRAGKEVQVITGSLQFGYSFATERAPDSHALRLFLRSLNLGYDSVAFAEQLLGGSRLNQTLQSIGIGNSLAQLLVFSQTFGFEGDMHYAGLTYFLKESIVLRS